MLKLDSVERPSQLILQWALYIDHLTITESNTVGNEHQKMF